MVDFKDITNQNQWWLTNKWIDFDKQILALRENAFNIERKNPKITNNINLIFGPRQVGKTTFMKLIII